MKVVESGVRFPSDTKDATEWAKEMEIEENELTVVIWPDSQDYIGLEGVTLINDDIGYRLFGDSAYLVPDALLYTDEPFSIGKGT